MPSSEGASPKRDAGLDAFRGLTVALMVLVNLQGSADFAPTQLKHAEWHGLTLADLVFPWFLFIVGISVALADGGRKPAALAVIRRSLVIFAIGVALGWALKPTLDPEQIRWTGVLQRIAIVYLACALIARRWGGILAVLLAAGICLLVHTLLLLFVTVPGEAGPSVAMGQGISGWMDRTLLPGRLHRQTWDPEGALGMLPSIATGLLGVAAVRLRLLHARVVEILGVTLLLIAGGLALSLILPVNKALWTSSFVLVTVGCAVPLWPLLSRMARRPLGARLLSLPILAGQTALTFYVAHMLLIALLIRSANGVTLWEAGFEGLTRLGLPGAWASVLFALAAGALAFAPMSWLKRRGLLIRA